DCSAIAIHRGYWNGVVGACARIIPVASILSRCRATNGRVGSILSPKHYESLDSLNSYCLQWQGGAFDPDRIQCVVSPESQPTLQQYGEERTFRCPDGTELTFTWHAKVGRWRIYFNPFSGRGSMLIGYVGAHLRTVKFN